MRFHIDLARHRTILTGDQGYFPDAMLVMESTRIVTTLVTIETNKD